MEELVRLPRVRLLALGERQGTLGPLPCNRCLGETDGKITRELVRGVRSRSIGGEHAEHQRTSGAGAAASRISSYIRSYRCRGE